MIRPRPTPPAPAASATRAWPSKCPPSSSVPGRGPRALGSVRGGNGQTDNGSGGDGGAQGDPHREEEQQQMQQKEPPQKVEYLQFPQPRPSLQTGLHKTPQSGGVQNATSRCDLPSPAVAVRNLVEQAQFAHLCTVRRPGKTVGGGTADIGGFVRFVHRSLGRLGQPLPAAIPLPGRRLASPFSFETKNQRCR